MAWLFRAKRKVPATVPTDTIVSLGQFDDNLSTRPMIAYLTLRFDDVLDPHRLRRGLERLMEMGDWRRCGARLRKKAGDEMEYHIPASFDAKRPAFIFSHVDHAVDIEHHPIASNLPRATNHASLHSCPDSIELARRPDGPRIIDDYCYSDEPQLSLHVVSFNNATLVSITWPHTFCDAVGMSSIIKAWVAVLNGREQDVLPVANFDHDPLTALGVKPENPYILEKSRLSVVGFFILAFRFLWDIWYHTGSRRYIYLPASVIAETRKAALHDLTEEHERQQQRTGQQSSGALSKPFLSENDILCTLLTRLNLNHLPHDSKQNVNIINVFNLRGPCSATLLPPEKGVYLGNALAQISTVVPASTLLAQPIATTASLIRQSVVEQSPYAQVDAWAALHRQSNSGLKYPLIFSDPWATLVHFTNWRHADYLNLDFEAVVVPGKQGRSLDERGGAKRGRPTFIVFNDETQGPPRRDFWVVLGRDHLGGYWFDGLSRDDIWERIGKELGEL